jgi:hypothetical protein
MQDVPIEGQILSAIARNRKSKGRRCVTLAVYASVAVSIVAVAINRSTPAIQIDASSPSSERI